MTYPSETQWTYRLRRSGHERTEALWLHYEVGGSPMSDDYSPDELTAGELWEMYRNEYANYYADRYPDHFRLGEVSIAWFIESDRGEFEAAPFNDVRHWETDSKPHDFLSFFTWPVHSVTGERLNFLRLPVRDQTWTRERTDKGGFIQEATGWKPSALQTVVNLDQLTAACGIEPIAPYLVSTREERN